MNNFLIFLKTLFRKKYSKTHKRFSELLNNPRVLEYPEEFLGPNYKAVLDFWLFLDGLTEDQWKTIDGRYRDFCNKQYSEWNTTTDEAIEASDGTIGWEFAVEAAGAAGAACAWDGFYSYAAYGQRENSSVCTSF